MFIKSVIASLLVFSLAACGGPAPDVNPPDPAEPEVVANTITPDQVIGTWGATLTVPGADIPILLHIDMGDEGEYSVSLDSPDQGAFGLEGTGAVIEDGQFKVDIPVIAANLSLTPEDGTLKGTYFQGIPLPVTFMPAEAAPKPARPQEAALIRDYVIEELTFDGGDAGVSLHGELTLPNGEGPFPAAVLITGSGPQNKDEELMGHKPFLILSDHLTRNGYAVLRYNDRGVAPSTGEFKTATTQDFAKDAAQALKTLLADPRIDAERAGYIGHSEGGFVAPLATQIEPASYMVFLAGPSQTLPDVILQQTRDMGDLASLPDITLNATQAMQMELFDLIRSDPDADTLQKEARRIIASSGVVPPGAIEMNITQMTSPWMVWMTKHDPLPSIRAYDGPVLALFGEKDLQVAPDANVADMREALSHPASMVKTLPGLNHLFQPADTGAMTEYAIIETTFDEGALKEITDWLSELNLQ